VPVILVAPPAFLAQLRKLLPAHTKAAITAEIAKDLTHATVAEIEKNLTAA
jgi:protein required for attachment to host cells